MSDLYTNMGRAYFSYLYSERVVDHPAMPREHTLFYHAIFS